jgi:glutathione synthase/RimK-type ligase-like ATP-grasp enzyme
VTRRVAYLTGRSWRDVAAAPGALPEIEAPDHALIVEAGARHDLEFAIRYWDDETLSAQDFDAAIIRSCWDYTQRCDEFVACIAAHERASVRVLNPSHVIAWNARKTYLKALGQAAIDTIWTERADAGAVAAAFDAFDAAEIVVKPQVGAGAMRTLRLKRNAWSEADLREGPIGPAMLQPYLCSIESEGERSLFWFGGEFSHAIRKAPQSGGWLANQPGSTRFFADPAPPAAMAAAEAARAAMPAGVFSVRIDLVQADGGDWRVIEIEAIEPYLFLLFAPEGAGVFASALARVLSG